MCTTSAQCATGAICSNGACTDAKTVFVTSTTTTGNTGGLTGADAICQQRAIAGGLSGTYKAWLSGGGVAAKNRITQSTIPYALPNGTKVADNFADLTDGTLDAAIAVTELGTTIFAYVYTGTTATGDASSNDCLGWTSTAITGGGSYFMQGYTSFADGLWTNSGSVNGCGVVMNHLYCFEQ